MPLAAIARDEAAVEIIDDIRSAPVQLRAYRRHVRGGKRRQHEATQIGRKYIRIEQRHDVARLFVNQIRVEN